jgi:phage-related protein
MKRKNPLIRHCLTLLTFVCMLWVVPSASAQSQAMTGQTGDPDVTRRQLADFDRFLDSHPELSQQLGKDPTLVNNEEFVENHAALQQFLQQHPELREEFSENPSRFMRQEQRFDRREDRNQRGDEDITRGELKNLDVFLDNHPQIAKQLQQNPSLINNEEFLENNPDLQRFLQEAPGVREEIRENPNAFMRQEQRFDNREDRNPMNDEDITRRELANMDRFLDSHPQLAQQLKNNPSLINNEEFVENNPDLQQFLQQHPGVREELRENPNAFMHQEQRFDRQEDRASNHGDRDITRGELRNLDDFLDNHPQIAKQLEKNPSLINNEEFLENNPDLQRFLQQAPGVREELRENPNAFMRQEQRFDRREDRGMSGDEDINRRELVNMDAFLDSHPEIAEQLRKNPSLVNNKDFVTHHPALQEFLKTHPETGEELRENPSAFMAQEQHFDQRNGFRRDRDLNRAELANMDAFLDSHPEIAEQLRKKPALVNDKKFVDKHAALQQFLTQHPEVREEFKENPVAFMQTEQQFERTQGSGFKRDSDVTRRELSSFNEFLGGHSQIAGELTKNPSLAKNEEYIENHPALQEYLKVHPEVREELMENPQSFLKSAQQTASTPAAHQEKSSKALPNPK